MQPFALKLNLQIRGQPFLGFVQLMKCKHRLRYSRKMRTFPKDWEVNFGDMAIEAEDCFEVGFDDIAGQISNNYDLGLRLVYGRMRVHLHVRILYCDVG